MLKDIVKKETKTKHQEVYETIPKDHERGMKRAS